jgi:hypothetical protein
MQYVMHKQRLKKTLIQASLESQNMDQATAIRKKLLVSHISGGPSLGPNEGLDES